MALGVFAGAITPAHATTSKPGRPASETVGNSGKATERLRLVTANPRSLPAFTCGSIDATLLNIRCTRPAVRSVIASWTALNGTCTICVPVMSLNSSPPRWNVLPLPLDAKSRAPGFFFA